MACTGPNYPTKEEVEKVYNSVIKLLQEKHKIFVSPPPNPQGFIDSRKKAEEDLKFALEKCIYQEYCESW